MASSFAFEAFLKSLIETVIWCNHQSEIESDIWPLTEDKRLDGLSEAEHKELLNQIIADRAERVRALNPSHTQDVMSLIRRGRLMIFFYQCSVFPGTTKAETGDYFDDFNYPPRDTWVAHIDEAAYLVAWVPPEYVADVDWATAICGDQSIMWLTEYNFEHASLFRQAGLWI